MKNLFYFIVFVLMVTTASFSQTENKSKTLLIRCDDLGNVSLG